MPLPIEANRALRPSRRGEHAARDAVQQFGEVDGPHQREQREQQGAEADGDHADDRRGALVVQRVDQRASRHLADQGRDGPEAERDPDLAVRPLVGGQVDGDERSEAGLHVGDEEIHHVERACAAGLAHE